MNKFRKTFGAILTAVMIMSVGSVNTIEAKAYTGGGEAANSYNDAVQLYGNTADGELTDTDKTDYWTFSIEQKRKVEFKINSGANYVAKKGSYNYSIQDSNFNIIKSGTTSPTVVDTFEMILTPGKYYVVITKASADSLVDYALSIVQDPYVCTESIQIECPDTVAVGSRIEIRANCVPENAGDSDCAWKIDNKSILDFERVYKTYNKKESHVRCDAVSCGTVTITATLCSNNSITASKTITVVPPKTKISKATNSKSKQMKVTCKKVKSVKGYQVQYSTNNDFTKATIMKIKKGNTITLNKLKKKTYYVRVRTYAKGADGKTYYSAWSDVKKVKIKK